MYKLEVLDGTVEDYFREHVKIRLIALVLLESMVDALSLLLEMIAVPRAELSVGGRPSAMSYETVRSWL